jgi:hypothetical protein
MIKVLSESTEEGACCVIFHYFNIFPYLAIH